MKINEKIHSQNFKEFIHIHTLFPSFIHSVIRNCQFFNNSTSQLKSPQTLILPDVQYLHTHESDMTCEFVVMADIYYHQNEFPFYTKKIVK